MLAIKTENLTKYYGKARGIINVNLEVDEGDFFGFIGPNGAGKSTTIRILLGLIKAGRGKATIFGKDVWSQNTEVLAQCGYLPSESQFYPSQTVKDVLELSAQVRKADCTAKAAELCERLMLDPERKVQDLSFGNRTKVAIVAALQHNPRLLILDEPTSGLDPLMQHEFFEILKEYNSLGTTVFLSSHVLSEIQNNCRNAAIIREGKILLSDSVENLTHTQAKRVQLRGEVDLSSLAEVNKLERKDDTVSFLYTGPIHELLELLSRSSVIDLNISEPSLEEIFMHYYK